VKHASQQQAANRPRRESLTPLPVAMPCVLSAYRIRSAPKHCVGEQPDMIQGRQSITDVGCRKAHASSTPSNFLSPPKRHHLPSEPRVQISGSRMVRSCGALPSLNLWSEFRCPPSGTEQSLPVGRSPRFVSRCDAVEIQGGAASSDSGLDGFLRGSHLRGGHSLNSAL